MRSELIVEEKSYNESSDSGYTLDHLDLLNLPLSIIDAKRQQLTASSGCGDAAKLEATIAKKSSVEQTSKHKGVYFCESNEDIKEIPCQLVPIEKPSLVSLYNNKPNFNLNIAHRTISDEFLVPTYKKRKISPVNCLSQFQFDSGDHNHQPESPKVLFPFKQTPSGNLKIDARQVAFQSDRVSVLVADPLTTTVNIRNTSDFIDVMPRGSEYTKTTAMDAIMTQGLSSSLGSLLAGRLDAPVRKEKESSEYEGRDTESILDPELNLNRLGYTAAEAICWTDVSLPEKKNLYLELYSRITNFSNADCKVYIDNEEFNCHLIVLQCYSEVFDNYVAVKKVELPADRCSPSSFAFIYEWMITGDPSYKELSRENALDIFNAAKYLKIKDLIEQCWAFIDNTEVFTEDTAFLLYVDAKSKNLPEVRELMLPRIQKFFLMLVSSQDWLELDLEDVKNFLTSNYICVNCEMEVFMSAVRWLKHDFSSRNKVRVDLFSCVRFGNIAPWQLVDIKRNPDNPDFSSLATDSEICKMIDDGLAFVIIKYWYGQENDDFQHWNSILALKEPVARNWSGMEKTYFTYREFLIYLDQYRRIQMMEKSKPKEKRRPVNVNLKSGKCSPRQSDEKIIPKVPTADEFLATRKGNLQIINIQHNEKLQPHRLDLRPTEDKPDNSPATSDVNSPRRRNRVLGQQQAATMIQAAYRGYLVRKMIAHLKKKGKLKVVNKNFRKPPSQLPWNIKPEKSEKKGSVAKKDAKPSKVLSMFQNAKCGDVKKHDRKKSGNVFTHKKKDLLTENSLFYHEHECVLIFGGVDQHNTYGIGRNTAKDIFRYVPDSNIWEFVGELPHPRCYHAVTFLIGRVYVVGGTDPRDDEVKDLVWSFDPVVRIWYNEGALQEARSCFGLVVSKKMMYAIGGKDSQGRVMASVERYDPSTASWNFVAPLRHPRMGIACAKYEDKIWVAGGMSGSKKRPLSDSVECYDTEFNQWTDIVKLRRPRGFACLFPMANNLYLIGGAGKSQDDSGATCSYNFMEVWNKTENRWEDHTEMEVARHGATVAYLGTQILIIGGVTTLYMRSLTNIECFCTTRNTWIRGMACLPLPLSGHATITLPPAILM